MFKTRRRKIIAACLGVLAVAIAAGFWVSPTFDCGTRIPSGAQVVQVTATDTELHLDSSTVRAGDVYLVLNPSAQSVSFISELPPDFQTGGRDLLPLSDDQIASIRRIGSAQGTADNGFSVHECGNVVKVTVFAGNYVLLIDLNQGGGGAPIPALLLVAVLEVLP